MTNWKEEYRRKHLVNVNDIPPIKVQNGDDPIEVAGPDEGPVSVSDSDLLVVNEAIQDLLAQLSFLPSLRGVMNDLRVSVVGGSISVSGGLTDAELRASPVPIMGVVTGPLTDAELRASEVPVIEASAADILLIEEQISELLSRLSFLPSLRGIANDLRVTVLGGAITVTGTLTTVTTVSTLTNQTNIGGRDASPIVPATSNILVTLANINNAVG